MLIESKKGAACHTGPWQTSLILFLLVATSLKRERGLAMQLPAVSGTQQHESPDVALCNVWISEGQTISLFENNALRPVTVTGLFAEVRQRLTINADLVISLKAEPGVPYDTFIAVLDVLKGTGADRISIASR